MKYLVTGATGFIGGQVVRQLLRARHQVVTVARTPDKAQDLAELGVTVVAGDICERESLRAPMTGVDGVFHLAAWYKVGVRDKRDAHRINVDGTRNVLEMMHELGIPKGVYTSTLAVFSDTHGMLVDETYRHPGPWLSVYDHTKWLAHYEVAEPLMKSGLPLVIVMPGLVYGPGDTSLVHQTLVQYLQQRLPLAPQRTAFCWGHVSDTARGHLLAMERGVPGESYIIAGPRHSLIDALHLAEQISGVPTPRLHPTPGLMRAMALGMSPLNLFFSLPESYTPEGIRTVAGTTYIGSNAKARRDLDFAPRPLEAGFQETLRYEMEQLGIRPI